ncbi:MAG: UbiA family prenyltransferase [Candidatus Diapherotrites archaeon]|nr:UbiA family prenyltransferase [Candidatus Diapherotrites archaeon]
MEKGIPATRESKLSGYWRLMRPMEWSKSAGSMFLAGVVAAYAFGVSFVTLGFAFGLISVILLWSGLYTLNDVMDWQEDAQHPVKKKRPIPSGLIQPNSALMFSYILLFFSLGIALLLQNALFFLCLLAMFINQLLYTSDPFSFKKRPVLDLLSGSVINPIFRFYAGWILLVPAFNAPLFALVFVVGLQIGGYGLYRLMSIEHEKKLGYTGTIARLNPTALRWFFYLAVAIGGLAYFAMCLSAQFFPALAVFGSLPLKYVWLAVASILLFPFYFNPMRKPDKASMEKAYKILYVHYLLFILGFLALYFLF